MKTQCYAKRRERLMESMSTQSILILPSAPVQDEHFTYHQDSDFYYLTGFEEFDAITVLLPKHQRFILFNRLSDPKTALWTGKLAGQTGACEIYGADEAHPFDQHEELLLDLLQDCEEIYYPIGRYEQCDQLIIRLLNSLKQSTRSGITSPSCLIDSSTLLHEMRLHKDEEEINRMKKVTEISCRAHIDMMKSCNVGIYEYELEATLLRGFVAGGARKAAYSSIVGSGENACVLHYVDNSAILKDGDLVLVDAGAKYQYYTADITRTFPVNGRFTPEQKLIYEIVLKTQLAVIELIRPGISFGALQDQCLITLTEGLVDIGLLEGEVTDLIEEKAYEPFFMHSVGHWLGIDVHDVGAYKIEGEWRKLEAGMVLTVEPGIYLSKDRLDLDEKWHSIGVRIEDDVLVTEVGCKVLTEAIPRTVNEIEALMRSSS